ncbi:MAG: methyltransferase [Sedimenticola sp.]
MRKDKHDYWMREAIKQGRQAQGVSYPNPPVGAVLVVDDKKIAAGHTQRPGGPHAEQMCIEQCRRHHGKIPADATLYVTLEPCVHSCVPLILNSGVRHVVFGIIDPNPKVNSGGLQALRDNHVKVEYLFQSAAITDDLEEYLWRAKNDMARGIQKKAVESWEDNTNAWVGHVQSDRSRYVYEGIYIPTLLDALGDVTDKTVLDVGGGAGEISRALQEQNAKVTYIDHAPAMVSKAKELDTESSRIDYREATTLDGLVKQEGARTRYDIVVANMVLHDIEDLDTLLAQIRQLLDKNGKFYASIIHPCFKPPRHGWVLDASGNRSHYAVDRYGNRGLLLDAVSGRGPGGIETLNIHRKLSCYLNRLCRHGFIIRATYEPAFKEDSEAPFELQDDYFRRSPVFCWVAEVEGA